MGPDATGLGQIYWYTLENEKGASKPKSLAELRSIQDFYVRYLLQGVEGVSEVASIGGFVKEYQIDVDPNKLFAYDVHVRICSYILPMLLLSSSCELLLFCM